MTRIAIPPGLATALAAFSSCDGYLTPAAAWIDCIVKSLDPDTERAIASIQAAITSMETPPECSSLQWAADGIADAREAIEVEYWAGAMTAIVGSRECFEHDRGQIGAAQKRLATIAAMAEELATLLDDHHAWAKAIGASVPLAFDLRLTQGHIQQPTVERRTPQEYLRYLAAKSLAHRAFPPNVRGERADSSMAPRVRAFDGLWRLFVGSSPRRVGLPLPPPSETAGLLRDLWADQMMEFTSDTVSHARSRRR